MATPRKEYFPPPQTVKDLKKGRFYRVSDLQNVLKNHGLSYSIYTVRDYETWKCTNYKCGKRHNEPVGSCLTCGAKIRKPIIHSPRTPGGGKGSGHRRYTDKDIKLIVKTFSGRG